MKKDMKKELKELQKFVDKMKATSSLNEKKVIIESIKDNEFITTALNYTYDPYKKYYVTAKTCKKMGHLADAELTGIVGDNPNDSFFTVLDDLHERLFTGHNAISIVTSFINAFPEYADLLYSIIDRNLEIRASESVINKVIPGLVPTFDVALATKFEPKFVDFDEEEWFGSRKLDGVRCIIRREGDKVTAYSRQGNEFTTIQKVLDDVTDINVEDDFVLDGEICLMDENGNEDFQGIMKEIKRKDHTIENPKYIIFDCLTLEEFDSQTGTEELLGRMGRWILDDVYLNIFDHLSVLKQEFVVDDKHLSEMIADADKNGFEGVMLRKNIGYEGKRSKNLLKCKKFYDEEYVVKGAVNGPFRVIVDGREEEINVLSAITIEHKGHEVSVGSGFSLDQRKEYSTDHSKILGKTITVQYFEETKNQQGGISLRFPTIKHIYENGRTV